MYGGNAYASAPYAGGGSAEAAPVEVIIPVEAHGRRRESIGLVTVTVPVVLPPPGVVVTARMVKTFAYPTPTLVDGRPT